VKSKRFCLYLPIFLWRGLSSVVFLSVTLAYSAQTVWRIYMPFGRSICGVQWRMKTWRVELPLAFLCFTRGSTFQWLHVLVNYFNHLFNVHITGGACLLVHVTDCSALSPHGWWLYCMMLLAFHWTITGLSQRRLSEVIRFTGHLELCYTRPNTSHSGISWTILLEKSSTFDLGRSLHRELVTQWKNITRILATFLLNIF